MKKSILRPSFSPAIALLVFLLRGSSFAQASAAEIRFSRDILPLLSDNCFHCHGPDPKEGRKGELRLDEEADAKRPKTGRPAIAPGKPQESEILHRLRSTDPDEIMPPPKSGKKLTPNQISLLTQWIREGAPWGKHWSFEPVRRPDLAEKNSSEIDAIILNRLRAEGLSPNPAAPKHTLIRRLKLDLTGLPPSPEEVDAFVEDTAPGAWERLVDRTLASPAFGERMAWDWLDAARYADSNGYQGDADRSMWPWRDWVVRAFNENLRYDQFTLWQLAGDLLPEPTREQILATGFNRNHMINGEGGRIAEENRVDYVMDMTETMGTVWMGLTLNCCRCHDHKFDPISQKDYYGFFSFFNQTPVTGSGGDPSTAPFLEITTAEQKKVLDAAKTEVAKSTSALDVEEKAVFKMSNRQKAWETDFAKTLPKSALEALKIAPTNRRPEQWNTLIQFFEKTHPDYGATLKDARTAHAALAKILLEVPRVMVMGDQPKRRATFVLDRGLYTQPGEEIQARVPESLPRMDADMAKANRLDLARWLVSGSHPLTARTAVNRFWQMLFGIGLIKTPEDFGVQAEYPVHPELLDWLAAEFMDSGWDVKHLLRTIVLSESYRRSSHTPSPVLRERDPDNRLFARGPRFRMPSWMIRDQALAIGGLLNATVGGKPVFPYQPSGVWDEATFGKRKYTASAGNDLYRRSLYTFWRRIVGPTVFFDTARRQVCEVKSLRTNTPMHALTTLNDTTYVEAARAFAQLLLQSTVEDSARLALAGKRALGRPPLPEEEAVWRRTLAKASAAFHAEPESAKKLLTVGDSPRDARIPEQTHAAWTLLCLNLLNLDETLTKE
jgi:hypothetical protein